MANANFYLDEMDSCPTHGIDAMRHTPVDGESPRNLDHWGCSECDFNAGSIDWVAVVSAHTGGPCPYCHGESPSTDGRTECGFCVQGVVPSKPW